MQNQTVVGQPAVTIPVVLCFSVCCFYQEDFKNHELPLARIKKIMRLEDDIAEAGAPRFMIAAEAPIIIAKACEIFVLEVGERLVTVGEV